MDKTQFAGLTRLAPGDPLSTDGYSFQFENPTITDNLLKVGARTHKHDGHAALADPTAPPDVTLAAGVIPAATEVGVCYTLVDAWGGETLPSDVEIVATPDPLPSPNTEPELAIDYDLGGSLVIGSYTYAIAVMDASGGVTPVGPSSTIERDPGHATAKVTISGLSDIVAASSGYAWRAYKAMNQSQMHFLASGLANIDALVDDGTLCGNCTEGAPAANTTGVSAGIGVVVPSGYTASATAVRIYLGEDGDFSSPSFAEELTPAQAASGVTYATLAVEDGKPPDVATTVAGANQIDPDTDLLDWHWKRPVATASGLPLPADDGDVRLVLDTGYGYGYTAASGWQPVKGAGSGHVILEDLTAMPSQPNLAFKASGDASVDVQNDPANARTLILISASGGGAGSGGTGGGALAAEVYAESLSEETAIPDNTAAVDSDAIVVAGDGVLGQDYDLQVELWLEHTYLSDVDVTLVAPDATEITLVSNFSTYLNDEAGYGSGWASGDRASFSENADTKPFRLTAGAYVIGDYLPEESFAALGGLDIAGSWHLKLKDSAGGDTGTLHSWALRFTKIDHVILTTDDDEIENRDGRLGLPMGRTRFRRGTKQFNTNSGITSGNWTFDSGNSTFPPPNLALKKARYTADVIDGGPLHFVGAGYAEILFPIGWTTLANIGTTKVGLEDDAGNFIYVEIGPSSTNIAATIKCKPVGQPVIDLSSTFTATMVGKTAAYIRFVRWRDFYLVEIWDVAPGSDSVDRNPITTHTFTVTPQANPKNALWAQAFGQNGEETFVRIEIQPTATSDPVIPANISMKGDGATDTERELVTFVGDYTTSGGEAALDVVGSARPNYEWDVQAFDSALLGVVRYMRDRSGMVTVSWDNSFDNGTPRLNLIPPPPQFHPKRTDYYFYVPWNTGGGESVHVDASGNIVRDAASPGSSKQIRGTITYPALWG